MVVMPGAIYPLDMLTNIRGKTSVILGATRGIGRATAALLRDEGARVVITSRELARAQDVAAQLGEGVEGRAVDVTDPAALADLFAEIGRFDHLVCTAASAVLGPLAEVPLDAVEALVASKFWGQYHAVRAAIPHLDPRGAVVLFSGTVTQKVLPGASAYAAVGAAIEAAGRTWAAELAPRRINTVVPGVIDTPVWDGLLDAASKQAHFAGVADALPVGRPGLASEVTKAVAFLLDNEFVDGASLVIDGGHRLI